MDNPKIKFVSLMKKYGPGFVAVSKSSGRVLAHGKDVKQMWQDAEKKKLDFSKFVVTHVPKFGSVSLYLRG
jgi:hypothetical protein